MHIDFARAAKSTDARHRAVVAPMSPLIPSHRPGRLTSLNEF
jgi:hypothetical protein